MENLNQQIDGYKDWFSYIASEDATDSQKMFSSESYYTTFWEHALHAIAVVSEEGVIVEANPSFCNLIGIETHEAVGINIRNLVADGEFREDMRMIDTMVLGRMVEGVTDERWNFRLNASGPFIPVRLKAMRIPANRNRPFKHIIIQVYDLRSTKYDMQGQNWGSKSWNQIGKEMVVRHFGKLCSLVLVLAIMLGLSGDLGRIVDTIIGDKTHQKQEQNVKNIDHETCPVHGHDCSNSSDKKNE